MTSTPKVGLRWALLAAATLGLASATACSVETETRPVRVGGYSTVQADVVPADIETYPRVPYEGGYAYFVNERWYYPQDGGWVVFNDEPPALQRQRPYVQRAPDAPRAYGSPYAAPQSGQYYQRPSPRAPYGEQRPDHDGRPGVQTAPPATRVQ